MKFFGKHNRNEKHEATLEEQLAEQQVAPGTQLRYDGNLIERFRGHHAALVDLAARAQGAARVSKDDDAKMYLNQFKSLLTEHMLEKSLRLYTYLNCCLTAESEGQELTRTMRREMSDASRKVTAFINRCNDSGIDDEHRAAVLAELAQLTTALSDRFACEEASIYALYQSPETFAGKATRPLAASAGRSRPGPTDAARATVHDMARNTGHETRFSSHHAATQEIRAAA